MIAGHRDTHFRLLKDVRAGDEIWVQDATGRRSYTVSEIQVVPPTEISVLQPSQETLLTLVTCYPFYWVGPAPSRFIVRAKADPVTSQAF